VLTFTQKKQQGITLLLGVEWPEEAGVPRAFPLLERGKRLVLLLLTYVCEIVRVVAQRSADDEWALPPRGGQLVKSLGVLDPSEHQVSLAERDRVHFPAVVPAQILLVYGRSGQGQFSRLLEEVHAVFVCSLGFFLGLEDGSRGVELDVSRQDCFRAVDEKKGV